MKISQSFLLIFCALWLLPGCGSFRSNQATPLTRENDTGSTSQNNSEQNPSSSQSPLPPPQQRIEFTATSKEFPHPERGFYGWGGDLIALNEVGSFSDSVAKGFPLVRCLTSLEAYRSGFSIPQAALDRLDANLRLVRSTGAKCIVRFFYNFPSGDYLSAQDASISNVENHILQLGPIMRKYRDIIPYFEAGFIGAWGEWHTSSNNLTSAENKLRVRKALLAAFPNQILFRSPQDLISWFPSPETISDDILGRIGFHNDCFLSGSTDTGTFPTSNLRGYAEALTSRVPMGGETCNAALPLRLSCADILAEGRQYHFTMLNWHYDRQFHESWVKEGCYNEVARRLGFRFRLEALELPFEIRAGQNLTIALKIRNEGWSKIFSDREFVIRLTHVVSKEVVELSDTSIQPRDLSPVLDSSPAPSLLLKFAVPGRLSPGSYEVSLGLPLKTLNEGSNAFPVRFANEDRLDLGQKWDSATSRFNTGAVLKVVLPPF